MAVFAPKDAIGKRARSSSAGISAAPASTKAAPPPRRWSPAPGSPTSAGYGVSDGQVNVDMVAVGSVNANRAYFERVVEDMALAEAQYPGWLGHLLTHPAEGPENYEEKGAIKVHVEVNGRV